MPKTLITYCSKSRQKNRYINGMRKWRSPVIL